MRMTARPSSGDAVAYRRVASSLRAALAGGEFDNGRQLPTEAQLSTTFAVSRQTIRRAFQELTAEGLVYRVRGRGTFASPVSPNARYVRSFGSVEDLLAYAEDSTMETVQPLVQRTDVSAASRLHLPSHNVMAGWVRRAYDGVPFCLTHIFLPPDIGRAVMNHGVMVKAGEVASRTVIASVESISGGIAGAHQTVTATTLNAHQASLIGSAEGAPVLQTDRVYYDRTATPLELAISYFNPERYAYRLELSR
jgi:GntR family transcriptional regulator